MLWGPLKIPSKNRCAATYAVGTLKNTFNCNQSRKIHANTAFRIPADYLQITCRIPVLSAKLVYRYLARNGDTCRLPAGFQYLAQNGDTGT